jgi:hypothetical protein
MATGVELNCWGEPGTTPTICLLLGRSIRPSGRSTGACAPAAAVKPITATKHPRIIEVIIPPAYQTAPYAA